MWEWCEDARRGGRRLDAVSIWARQARDEQADESTPIFCAMASAWEDRQRQVAGGRNAVDTARHRERHAGVPEPRSGSGSSPDQRPRDIGRSRNLASMNTMPPPAPISTPEGTLEYRAKHRREAQVMPLTAGGRHALQLREEDTGRHVCEVVRLVPRT
ncbi:hypothetical protein PHK61_31270 [Actinomycetospora lutea]|uniref:hypothetical protein n=1 Tax=Actinomycetospora lutea TaxID=663604 RepID=UPI002366FB28|nr:hypothetical protein [Actinomycetospora lutea]MDD7942900.1 hypothetical protein [Actinomycetospora lutea]